MSSAQPLDRRTKKTKQHLRNALASLIQETDFQSITVQDITDRADINRATFYSHYRDKYDFVEKIAEEILGEFEDIINSKGSTSSYSPSTYQLNLSIFMHIEKHNIFYKTIFSIKGSSKFLMQLLDILNATIDRRRTLKHTYEKERVVPTDIVNSFIASAYIGVIKNWIDHEMPYPPEYIAEKLTYLLERKMQE
ncbi:TetR-like C-terminal domain-containing protein [Ureibacillus sp. NPDC094379]